MTWLFLEALAVAVAGGLKIPIVYNSSGYDSMDALQLLDGIIDTYMPDLKYSSNDSAQRCSGADNYWEVATAALKEMLRQVGQLELDHEGVAKKFSGLSPRSLGHRPTLASCVNTSRPTEH
jgi:putative pyruvate formate lyase activating enzyme